MRKSRNDARCRYWRPFGELLTQMERNGVRVDVSDKLPAAEDLAQRDRDRAELHFRQWAASYCPEAWFINPGSSAQVHLIVCKLE